ncbi:MAG TPA: hypothetical protein VFP36_00820 [Usitatibacter sp.]|nr:hypothetical protein [Usitatibacter sp.]
MVVVLDGSVVVEKVDELDGLVVVVEDDGLLVEEFSEAEPLSELLELWFELLLAPFVPLDPILLVAPLVPLELVALFLLWSLELEALSAKTGVAARAPTTAAARILRVNCTGFMLFLL